jgi:hypothetical protein
LDRWLKFGWDRRDNATGLRGRDYAGRQWLGRAYAQLLRGFHHDDLRMQSIRRFDFFVLVAHRN